MKTKLTILIGAVMIFNCLMISNVLSQSPWQNYGVLFNSYNQPDYASGIFPPIESIGIGDFKTAGTVPQAALDIVIPYLPFPSFPRGAGEAIHTTVSNDYDHAWRMYLYTGTSPGQEEFNITKFRSKDDVQLDVVQKGNMYFKTANTLRMTIDGYNDGEVAIGNNLTPIPGLRLTVDNDVNTLTSAFKHGYWIGHTLVLSKPGTDNTFLGENTGSSWTSTAVRNFFGGTNAGQLNSTGLENVFLGVSAGESNTTASYNTFLGTFAGQQNQTGQYDTYVGSYSGMTNTTGSNNTFVGHHSGGVNTGNRNTLIGYHAGYSGSGDDNVALGQSALAFMGFHAKQNTVVGTLAGYNVDEGTSNTFLGYRSGVFNYSGNGNVFVGHNSAVLNNTGSYNICIGTESDCGSSLTNACAIGYQASVKNSNQMILGKNVNIGIGLSGDPTGPRSKLEIKSGVANSSGLQFTNLSSLSFPAGVTAATFLTVDPNGVVVLKDAPAGSGDVSYCGGTSGDLNYVTRWDNVSGTVKEICKSQIYDDLTNVGIGISTSSPSQKLEINGNMALSSYSNKIYLSSTRMLATEGPGAPSFPSNLYLGLNAGNVSVPNTNYANTAIGTLSLSSLNASAGGNTSVGFATGYSITSGSSNSLFGNQAGYNTTTGSQNILIGHHAGLYNTTGSNNVLIGVDAAGGSSSNSNNGVIIGLQSGYHNISDYNTFIGESAGYSHINGTGNTYIGSQSDIDPYQGSNTFTNVTLLGSQTRVTLPSSITSVSNATAIGHGANVNCDNCVVLGNSSASVLMGWSDVPGLSGGAAGQYRLYVNNAPSGSTPRAAYFNGDIYCTGLYLPSDANLKTNINALRSVSSILSGLHPVSYQFDSVQFSRLNLPPGNQYGLLASDVAAVLPNLVSLQKLPPVLDSLGNIAAPEIQFQSVNYVGIIPILIQAVQDQQLRIDSLTSHDSLTNARLDQLESEINACCSLRQRTRPNDGSIISVELSFERSIILNQNEPNPFAEQTRITYSIPDNILKAEIIFYTNDGVIMKTVVIPERGSGQLNVYAADLSSGIYSYTLIADGKVIDTKKMVCTK